MAKTIWKYTLLASPQVLSMPEGAAVLAVQIQNKYIALWAQIDPEAPLMERRFIVYGTGQNIPDEPGIYVGTIQDCSLVWHVYEVAR